MPTTVDLSGGPQEVYVNVEQELEPREGPNGNFYVLPVQDRDGRMRELIWANRLANAVLAEFGDAGISEGWVKVTRQGEGFETDYTVEVLES